MVPILALITLNPVRDLWIFREDSCSMEARYDVAHRHAFQPCRIENAGEIVPIHGFSWVVGAESMALLSSLSLEGSKGTVVKRLKYVCCVGR